jgi:hypothetical protein
MKVEIVIHPDRRHLLDSHSTCLIDVGAPLNAPVAPDLGIDGKGSDQYDKEKRYCQSRHAYTISSPRIVPLLVAK